MSALDASRRAYRAVRSQPTVNRVATSVVRAVVPRSRRGHFFIDHLPRLGPVVATLPDGSTLRLVGERAEALSNEIFWLGWDAPEPETARVFWDLASSADCIVDVGAHVGYYSVVAARANPAARVIAFEALPHVADRLLHHIELNGVGNVTVQRVAVGDRVGTGTMWFTTAIPVPSSSGLAGDFVRQNDAVASVEVPLTTIDAFAAEHDLCIDLLKIDTETTEPDVLAGARTVLLRDRPTVICEVLAVHDVDRRVDALVRELGYRAALLTGSGVVPADRIVADQQWRNWLLTPG